MSTPDLRLFNKPDNDTLSHASMTTMNFEINRTLGKLQLHQRCCSFSGYVSLKEQPEPHLHCDDTNFFQRPQSFSRSTLVTNVCSNQCEYLCEVSAVLIKLRTDFFAMRIHVAQFVDQCPLNRQPFDFMVPLVGLNPRKTTSTFPNTSRVSKPLSSMINVLFMVAAIMESEAGLAALISNAPRAGFQQCCSFRPVLKQVRLPHHASHSHPDSRFLIDKRHRVLRTRFRSSSREIVLNNLRQQGGTHSTTQMACASLFILLLSVA